MRRIQDWISICSLALLGGGCSTFSADPGAPAQPTAAAPAIPAAGTDHAAPGLASSNTLMRDLSNLTLATVLEIALSNNASFAEFEANRAAANAEIIEAFRYPNPEAELSLGAARARGAESGDLSAEFGIGLFQPIERPSKRLARRAAAELSGPIVEHEEELFALTLRKEVEEAYWTIQYQIEARKLADDNARIASDIEATVARRIEAGEAAKSDHIRARVELLQARRQVQIRDRHILGARAALNALCGGGLGEEFVIVDALKSDNADPSLEAARQSIQFHPALARADAEIERQHAVIRREEAARYPDFRPGIQAGHESDKDSVALSFGFEIPISNRNQGGIARAHAELARLEAQRKRIQIEVERDLKRAWESYQGAKEQTLNIGPELREEAAEALKLEKLLYEEGETDLLKLLDARRIWQATEGEYLQAMYDSAIALAELERAAGRESPP